MREWKEEKERGVKEVRKERIRRKESERKKE